MTMCLRLRANASSFSTRFSHPFSPPKHLLNPNPKPPSLSFKPRSRCAPRFSTNVTMSSQTVVEHVVLFKVKDDADQSKINAMIAGLNGLASLDSVLHLTAGPLLRNRSPAFGFTHMLHSRYGSKDDLSSYAQNPAHVSVVKESVLPICDDVMAVDWVAGGLRGAVSPPLGSALRLSFLKLKDDSGEDAKSEVLETIKGIEDSFGGISQLSVGENFSPARAKGFSIASLAVFPGPAELEAVDSDKELVNSQKDKVRAYLESVIVVDYVVSLPQSASL